MKAIRSIVLSTVVCASLLAAGTASGTTLTPVMTGLDNPRGLAFAKNGALYVAEAGRGGTGPCQVLRGVTACYGPTGRISRYWKGHQRAVVTGLPSYITPTDATGPHDLTVHGHKALVTLGWGENPALRNTPPSNVWQQFGHLVRANLKGKGKWKLGTDISAFEAAANPDGGVVDTNPYGIVGLKKHQLLVTDAGGNDLLSVGRPEGKDKGKHAGKHDDRAGVLRAAGRRRPRRTGLRQDAGGQRPEPAGLACLRPRRQALHLDQLHRGRNRRGGAGRPVGARNQLDLEGRSPPECGLRHGGERNYGPERLAFVRLGLRVRDV
jgi:hypothetical protein